MRILLLPFFLLSLTLTAAPPAGLYLSTDNGACWEEFSAGLPEDARVSATYDHRGTLFLATHNRGLYRLPADATEWRPVHRGLPGPGEYFQALSLHAHGNHLFLGTFANGIFRSADNGISWVRLPPRHPEVIGAFLSVGPRLLAGTHSGLWASDDQGESWHRVGAWRQRINALALHDDRVVLARQNGLGILDGAEISWSDAQSLTALIRFIPSGKQLYAVSVGGELFRTTDGDKWEGRPAVGWGGAPARLPEALVNPLLPTTGGQPVRGLITPTSRGWVLAENAGC